MAKGVTGRRFSLRMIFTGLVAALLVVFAVIIATLAATQLREGIEAQLVARGSSLASLLGRSVTSFFTVGADMKEDIASVAAEDVVVFVAVTDDEGEVVGRLAKEGGADLLAAYLAAPAAGAPSESVIVATSPIRVERPTRSAASMDELDFQLGGAPTPTEMETVDVGRAHVAISKAEMRDDVSEAMLWIVGVTLVFLVFGIFAAMGVSLLLGRALSKMVDFAVAMSRGDYQAVGRVDSRIREVGELADSFAIMRESLAMVADQARSIAAGDLSRRVSGAGQLGEAFNAMVESLSKLVGQIKKAAIQIASASAEILAASKQAEKGSAEQASSINQTTTTMDELLSASKQIAASADSVVRIAEQTLGAAKAGEEAVQQGISGMEEIAENNRQTAERILELSERNQQIGNIVDLIDEIADKSDLLALNAAIEGAKAGEAGKGFAVVATEMRALAENVVESTKEIKSLITEIQKASNSSVLATEGQMKATERGTQIAVRTGEQLEKILQMVEQTTEAAKQISLATQQQRTGTEQVVQSMSEIAKIAKTNVSGAAQTTASTVELSDLAEELKKAVSQFRLGAEAR